MILNIIHKLYAIVIIPFYYCTLELLLLTRENIKAISRSLFIGVILFTVASTLGYYQLALWCLYWIGLGILSSVGFGFGMHTFVLFLGPHIAAVTLAANSCKSLNFPEPPYPKEIICPNSNFEESITFAQVLYKVSLESFMWGLGTAIGELPPYLAARLKGQAISRKKTGGDDPDLSIQVAGWELWMIRVINKIGFFGLLLCASIPNPLFDAAGVASGIAQVPFLSFFGATFIGKAVIKVLLQTSFVIFIFHSKNLDSIVNQIDERLNRFSYTRDLNLQKFLDEERKKVIERGSKETVKTSSIAWLFNMLTNVLMILFIYSLIVTLSQKYIARRDRIKRSE